LGEQLLSLAQNVQDPTLLAGAHLALGETLCFLGEFAAARAHVEQGIAVYDPRHHSLSAFLYVADFKVACLSYAAWTLWFLGYPDQALKRSQEARSLAQELAHPFSLAAALNYWVAMVYRFRREGPAVQELTEAGIVFANEQGFSSWVAVGIILRGWTLTEQGQVEEGIAQMRQGLAARRAAGPEHVRPYLFALLAEAYGRVGQAEEGLGVLAEALAMVDKNGERMYEAELYRLKGQLTLQSKVPSPKSQAEEAEECFRNAIEIARKQQVKSLELRATTSLARLWQQQGKQKDAHQMLAEIYGWFTEGFDTKDLQEAKALLEELNH